MGSVRAPETRCRTLGRAFSVRDSVHSNLVRVAPVVVATQGPVEDLGVHDAQCRPPSHFASGAVYDYAFIVGLRVVG